MPPISFYSPKNLSGVFRGYIRRKVSYNGLKPFLVINLTLVKENQTLLLLILIEKPLK